MPSNGSVNNVKLHQTYQRARGAYYTPDVVTTHLAEWLMKGEPRSILEPSAGDGAFLRAVLSQLTANGSRRTEITAVELNREAIDSAKSRLPARRVKFVHADFLTFSATGFCAVIGNPPFVRLRHLPKAERITALNAAEDALGYPMDPSGSVWMPFALHASHRLRPGGRLALVLPLDATYVRYARPFWDRLARVFGNLTVIRVRERLFADLSQDVVLLLAESAGSQTTTIRFEAYNTLRDLQTASAEVRSNINVEDVVRGKRAFLHALLPYGLRELLEHRLDQKLISAGLVARFRIGYVAGHKTYFHPPADEVSRRKLPKRSLVPTVATAKVLRGSGLRTSRLVARGECEHLFYPLGRELSPAEQAYVAFGEESGVANAYKCRARTPWYLVPYVSAPDILMSVFSDRPFVAINDGSLVASNSLLCATLLEGSVDEFATRWYNSLTHLQCELNVHSLGGGVFVLVPREAAAVRLIRKVQSNKVVLARIDRALRDGDIGAAYECGDEHSLRKQLRLTPRAVELIRDGVTTLRRWRTAGSSAANGSVEEVDEDLAILEA